MSNDPNYQDFLPKLKDQTSQTKKRVKEPISELTIASIKDQLVVQNEVEEVLSVIGNGKEAYVLLALEKHLKEPLCVKAFRFYTGTNVLRLSGTHHLDAIDMAFIGAKQEFWNLQALYQAGISVPKPRKLLGNMVLMDFIHAKEDPLKPAPLLSELNSSCLSEPVDLFHEAIGILVNMFLNAHYIHGDYSDHNLMITDQGLITMDVSQSVQYNQKTFVDTPIRLRIDKAFAIFRIDLINLNRSFQKKFRLSIDVENVCEEVTQELPKKLQHFLTRSEPYLSGSQYVPELYDQKESFRHQSVYQRSKRVYQKKKR